MTTSTNLSGPLSVGNVVNAGLQLYSNHFKQYFRVAVQATLWAILPFVGLLVVVVGFAGLQVQNPGLIALLVPIWVGLTLYCMSRYMAESATIARLAFGELTHRPESTAEASRYTRSRQWAFLGVALLIGLLYGVLMIGLYIAIAAIVFVMFATAGGLSVFQTGSFEQWVSTNPGLVLAFVLILLLLIGFVLLMFLWAAARFAIVEVPLAIETEVGVTRSIGRSWQLTRKSAWRIVLILTVTFLITIPLQLLAQVLASMLQAVLLNVLSASTYGFEFVVLAATYMIGLITSVIVLPLWQTIKAVIYYDLRSRREGLDLELRDREFN